MVIKENKNYDKSGNITMYGTKHCNADENEVVTYYAKDDGAALGHIQEVDNMIKNINNYTSELETNFYDCLYDAEVLEELHKRLRSVEQEMFRIAKIL